MVIAIVGILSTLVISRLETSRVKARNSSAKADITTAGRAIETFKADDSSGGDVIDAATVNGGAIASLSLTGVANIATSSWPAFFSGTANFTSGRASYAVRILRTPSTLYTYSYLTANGIGKQTSQGIDATCYYLNTTVDSSSGVSDTAFYILNGTSGNGAAYNSIPSSFAGINCP